MLSAGVSARGVHYRPSTVTVTDTDKRTHSKSRLTDTDAHTHKIRSTDELACMFGMHIKNLQQKIVTGEILTI